MTRSHILSTARLVATTWLDDEEDLLLEIHATSETTAYVAGEAPWSRAKAVEKLAKYREENDRDGTGKYRIVDAADGRLVGRAGVSSFDRDAGEYELGYVLKPEYWGRGLATEIAAAMAGRFLSLRLSDHLIAFSDPDNHASHKVLAKIGMRPAGARNVGGADALVFRMDRHERRGV